MSVVNSEKLIEFKKYGSEEFNVMTAPINLPRESKTSSLAIRIKVVNGETGEFKEKFFTLKDRQREYLIGRHPSCDLVLDSVEVSRIHGRIWYQDGQCFFTDLGSTVGSQIDKQEVGINQVHPLKQDSLLRIGGYVLTITTMPTDDCANQIQSSAETTLTSSPLRQGGAENLTVRCIQVIEETHDVKTFRFVAEPAKLFSYKPGQFMTLNLEIEGKKVRRSYTLSSTPSRPHVLEITVKRVPPPTGVADAPPGLVSNWLHEQITVGSQVQLTNPMGQFTVDDTAQKLMFICAGSGITPLMSMSRWLLDMGSEIDVVLIYSIRTLKDFIYRHELESMAARYDNFKLAVTITRPESGLAWAGYTGRLNDLMLRAIAPDWQERTAYVCGPNPFMEGVKTMLKTLGLPMKNYHQESFGDSSSQKKSSANEKVDRPETKVTAVSATRSQERSSIVVFAKSDREIPGDEAETILDLAEQEGIELPSGCRMGACGACKLPLLEGEVDYDDDPDCEPGHLLTCIARPLGKVVVEA